MDGVTIPLSVGQVNRVFAKRPKIGNYCIFCNADLVGLCPRCRLAPYCSTNCLEADAPTHDLICDSLLFSSQPSGGYVSGIVFTPQGRGPSIKIIRRTLNFGEGPRDTMEQTWLRMAGFTEVDIVRLNAARGRKLSYTLEIWSFPDARARLYGQNNAIRTVTDGFMAKQWYGPVMVMHRTGLHGHALEPIEQRSFYYNVTGQDFRDVVDFFRCAGDDQPAIPRPIRTHFIPILGIRIKWPQMPSAPAGAASNNWFWSTTLETVIIPIDHPMFDPKFLKSNYIVQPEIGRLIDMPLICYRPTPIPPRQYASSGCPDGACSSLFVEVDPDHHFFGNSAVDIPSMGGELLVARQDWFNDQKPPLHAKHLAVLIKWINNVIQPALEFLASYAESGSYPPCCRPLPPYSFFPGLMERLEKADPQMRVWLRWNVKQFLTRYVTKNVFGAYFEQNRKEFLTMGHRRWRCVENPYGGMFKADLAGSDSPVRMHSGHMSGLWDRSVLQPNPPRSVGSSSSSGRASSEENDSETLTSECDCGEPDGPEQPAESP